MAEPLLAGGPLFKIWRRSPAAVAAAELSSAAERLRRRNPRLRRLSSAAAAEPRRLRNSFDAPKKRARIFYDRLLLWLVSDERPEVMTFNPN